MVIVNLKLKYSADLNKQLVVNFESVEMMF